MTEMYEFRFLVILEKDFKQKSEIALLYVTNIERAKPSKSEFFF